jgi:hypothetical protein
MGEQGGPCDKKCEFCYYAHQKNLVFYSLETMIQHANMMRWYYGLEACDISGGEATIYKPIVTLVRHCALIGLKPTIITHGQNLRDDFRLGATTYPLHQEIEDAGLEDWLVSLHGGSPASHDRILCQEGSFERLTKGLELVKRPVRFNTTICADNYQDFPVNVLKDRPPTVWNPIMFNPFHYWSDKTGETEIDFQVRYRDAAPYLARAIEELEPLGWEVNVRYWPLCIAQEFGFAANVSGYHQVPFDPWEWRLNVTARVPMEQITKEGGWYASERLRSLGGMAGRDCAACSGCSLTDVCDKPPVQYQQKYGTEELRIVSGTVESDPLVFQRARAPLEEVACK